MNAEAIQQAYEKFIESEERRSGSGPREYVYASAWSACTRQIALDLIRPDAKTPFPVDTLANFRRGNDRARDIKADITRVGRFCDPPFDVVGAEERFELRDKKGRVAIVGKVDFRIKFGGSKQSHPVETKSWHPNLIQNVKRFEDLLGNRWTRKGCHQLLAYLLATNEPLGFMLLDRPGIPRFLEVRLFEHLEKIEDFLQRAEIAMDAKELHRRQAEAWDSLAVKMPNVLLSTDPLPPFIDDPSECRVCPFLGSACNPPLKYDGAAIITSEEVLASLETHEALKPTSKEFGGIHDELGEFFERMTPKTHKTDSKRQIIGGKFLIETWYSKHTGYNFPDEKTKKSFQKSDDVGKFNWKVTKVTE